MKRILIRLLVFMFGFCGLLVFSQNNTEASILKNGVTYIVSTGNDLFNLLTSSTYWNQVGGPPAELNIKVTDDITLPGGLPNIYSKLQKVNVDFAGHQFYVLDQGASVVEIPSDSKAQVTVSNVHIDSNATSNYVTGIPTPAGGLNGWGYLSTYFGILFSSAFAPASIVFNTSAQVTYNNIYYNLPNDLSYNQPLCTYYISVNFTGNNYIRTGVHLQQLAEIPNIKVSDGTTTMIAGDGAAGLASGMFLPFFNQLNNKTFPIDIAPGATLSITNQDTVAPMFAFWGTANAININNSGTLNINGATPNAPIFGSLVNGVSLKANPQAITNFKALGPIFDGTKMGTANFNATLVTGSKTALVSQNAAPFNNSGSWSNSNISVMMGSKLLTYAGGPARGGITDAPNHDISFSFVGGSLAQSFQKSDIFPIPKTADGYDNLNPHFSKQFENGNTASSNMVTNPMDSGALISSSLTPVSLGAGNYDWNYGLDQLSSKDEFLPRTSGDKLHFRIIDTRSAKPNFKITAAYEPDQAQQPFSVWFKHRASDDVSNASQLTGNAQTILTGNQMVSDNGSYSSDFGDDAGLAIRANNRVRTGHYSGVVDWTLVNGI